MAGTENLQPQPAFPSFHIWPPSDRTGGAVTSHLIQTLSTPSPLTKRYSTLSPDDAKVAATSIEESAFAAASSAEIDGADENGLGIERLNAYSKEISKRTVEVLKGGEQNVGGDGVVLGENV